MLTRLEVVKVRIPSAKPITATQWMFPERSTIMHADEHCVLQSFGEEPFQMASLSVSKEPKDTWFRAVTLIVLSFAEDHSCLTSL